MEGASGVSVRGAPRQHEATQGIVRHMEGGSGVSMRGAPSQREAERGIVWHMEGASGVSNRQQRALCGTWKGQAVSA